MARPGLLTHRKFIRLARTLKSDALAFGHLGIIWDACYESGDDNVGSAEDLEYLARWAGEPGVLASALVQSGFIDIDEDGTHRVHDLYDHAPDYVQRRMEREHERRSKGVTIQELRAKAGRASGVARRAKSGTNDEHVLNTCSTNGEQTGTNGATPAPITHHPHPSPAPAPAQEESGDTSPEPPVSSRIPSSDVDAVVLHYQTKHPKARPGTKERAKITGRLKEGYSVEHCCLAIDGCHKSPWHCGENPDGRVYQSLDLIFRSSSKVQQFIELATGDKRPVLSQRTQRTMRAAQSYLDRRFGDGSSEQNGNGAVRQPDFGAGVREGQGVR